MKRNPKSVAVLPMLSRSFFRSGCNNAGPPFGGPALPVRSVCFEAPGYGSTAYSEMLAGVKPVAGAGPTVQVLVDWL